MANYYKIRLEWNDGKWEKTQKGAFTTKEQAISQCTDELISQGYKVFSPTGEIVYPIYYNTLAVQMENDGVTTDTQYWSDVFDGKIIPDIEFVKTIIERYSSLVNSKSKVECTSYKGTKIYKIPTSLFKIEWFDKKKKTASNISTVFSGGYFGFYSDTGLIFTLPAGNLVCDIDVDSVDSRVLHYLNERKISNGKLYFSANKNSDKNFRNSMVSTLIINDEYKASIEKVNTVENDKYLYAVSGAPIISKSKYVSNYLDEGWDTSIDRATSHIFLGLCDNENVYIFEYTTLLSNSFAEVYNKFMDFGFTELIKLDGGGSVYARVDNEIVAETDENRQINNIITIRVEC